LLGEFAADDRPRISTKVSIDASTGDIQGQIRASLEESFTRLNVSHVPLLQLHNPLGNGPKQLPIDAVLGHGGVVDTFSMLKAEGVIDYAGFTALGSPEACIEAVDSGCMDTAQVYFNLINPSAGVAVASDWHSEDYRDLLARCHAQDVGVLAIRVYAAGLLASRDRHGREIPVTSNAAYEAERQRADAISIAIARMPGTPAQKALRFVLDHPHVDAAVIGLADVDHLEQALAVPGMASVPDDVGAALDTLWQNNYLQSLGRHS
jgi:L-galactose dehydrogenase/L-glyceraldehyde 3-phosphate reductase